MLKYSGFTLLELIIVIVAISILLFIALPRFRGMDEEAKIAQAKGDLGALQTAVESYYIYHNNDYPGDLADLTTATPNVIGPSLPTDPFNPGVNYGYSCPGSVGQRQYYVISSVGPGGNGNATISMAGIINEINGSSCIYVSNASQDTQP